MLDLETRLSRHASQLESFAPEIDLPEVRSAAAAAHERGIRVPVHISHRKAVIALAILALGLIAAAVGYSLRSETVEEGPLLGKFIEMEVAPDGLPFLIYSDQATGGTVFAKCADRFCEGEPILTRFDGMFPTVAMRDDGRPLIWIDGPDGEPVGPWLLDCSNAECSDYEQIDIGSMPTQIEDVAPSGRALMRYTDDAGRLVMGICADAGCASGITAVVVSDNAHGPHYDAFFAPGDRPAVLYAEDDELRLATCVDPDCARDLQSVVVTTGDFEDGTPVAAAVGPEGDIWVAHGRYGVQIAHCTDETCSGTETAPLAVDQKAWRVEALVGADGLPLFVYNWSEDTRTDVLEVARCEDASCTRGTVATIHRGQRIGSFSITLGDTGNPVLGVRTEEGVVATVCADSGCIEGALDVLEWDQTVSTTTTTTTNTEPPSEAGGWTRVASIDDAFGSGAAITGLTSHAGTLVAVGHLCDGAGCSPTAWSSNDGTIWNQHRIAESGFAAQVASGRAGFVVTGCSDHEQCELAVWHSSDGTEWEPSSLEGCGAGPASELCGIGQDARLIGGPNGYALYGPGDAGWVIWTSRDGIAWQLVDLGLGGPYPLGVWSFEDRFAAIVETCDEEGNCPKRLWTSSDGTDWVERDDEAARWLYIEQWPLSWSNGALVVGWQDREGDFEFEPYVWTSADGLTWEMTPLVDAPPGNAIVPFAGGLFEASVEFDNLENRDRAFTWTSRDGLHWEVQEWPYNEFPAVEGRRAARLGDGVLVVADGIWTWYPG